MKRSGHDATPATAATVVVPDSVAPGTPVPGVIATEMSPVTPVSVFPTAWCATTCTAGEMVPPLDVGVGWTVNASLLGAPTVMLNGALVVPVGPVAAAV